MYYNFVRIDQALRVMPVMTSGITDRLWEIGDIVNLREGRLAEKQKRGRDASFYRVYAPAGEQRKNRRPAGDA
jgi:hypothetical protein